MIRIFILSTIFLSLPLIVFGGDDSLEKKEFDKPIYPEKSYFVGVPLAFFVGFGTGHFYAKDTWGGIRYIAYDIAGIGLGFLTMHFDGYSNRSVALAVAITVVNRIYQSVSAAESIYQYNKNPFLREITLFESNEVTKYLTIRTDGVYRFGLVGF
ncbi:MAG: hypothetical protein N2746_12455 [Deltaproteobacteria bacterium]|nr:hypothetical protein [Deltaproteobacteria bacterium]